MPDANRLTIHVMAAVGEHELEMIAQRTTTGLAAAKARGVKLGNPRWAAANRQGADRARLGEAVAERRQPRGRSVGRAWLQFQAARVITRWRCRHGRLFGNGVPCVTRSPPALKPISHFQPR